MQPAFMTRRIWDPTVTDAGDARQTYEPVPKAQRIAWPDRVVADECEPLEGDRLGAAPCRDFADGDRARRRVRRRPHHQQAGSNGRTRPRLRRGLLRAKRRCYAAAECSLRFYRASTRLPASVAALPFRNGSFDIVTAIETHFWWPELPANLREVRRVLKPSGRLAIIAEVYRGANSTTSRVAAHQAARVGMTLLTVDEHRDRLVEAGFDDVQIDTVDDHGWICALATKPSDV